jgi:hypothetical protein
MFTNIDEANEALRQLRGAADELSELIKKDTSEQGIDTYSEDDIYHISGAAIIDNCIEQFNTEKEDGERYTALEFDSTNMVLPRFLCQKLVNIVEHEFCVRIFEQPEQPVELSIDNDNSNTDAVPEFEYDADIEDGTEDVAINPIVEPINDEEE